MVTHSFRIDCHIREYGSCSPNSKMLGRAKYLAVDSYNSLIRRVILASKMYTNIDGDYRSSLPLPSYLLLRLETLCLNGSQQTCAVRAMSKPVVPEFSQACCC